MNPYRCYEGKRVRVHSISNAISKNPDAPSTECEPIEGRVMDAINYLVLFVCLMEENNNDK